MLKGGSFLVLCGVNMNVCGFCGLFCIVCVFFIK